MQAASGSLIANLKTSLADSDHAWSVASVTETSYVAVIATVPTDMLQKTVSLFSPLVRVAVGSRAPLSIAYVAKLTAGGSYQSAVLFVDGTALSVTDSALHTQVMALAAAHSTAIDSAVTASLQYGPQSNDSFET